ncbi:MAG: hypothetical protein IT424_05590 [Pirellulales bacterium]|nr:hypothetical protein [Pirellulales bacterium]
MKVRELLAAASLPPMLMALSVLFAAGCENKEKLLDAETPSGQVEIERDRDTGEVEVDATKKDETVVDVDVPGADVEVTRDPQSGDVDAK